MTGGMPGAAATNTTVTVVTANDRSIVIGVIGTVQEGTRRWRLSPPLQWR